MMTAWDIKVQDNSLVSKWMEDHFCQIIVKEIGQDYIMSIDSEDSREYFEDCLGKFNDNFISAIEIAVAQNIYLNANGFEEDSGMSLLFKTTSATEMYGSEQKRELQLFNRYYSTSHCAFQHPKSVPNSWTPYQVPGVSYVSSQVYYTDKSILRPTKWEQPFFGGRFTKEALKPQPPSPATILTAQKIFNLKETFQSLQRSNVGLRCEIVTRLSLESEVPTDEQIDESETWLQRLVTTFDKCEIVDQTTVSKKKPVFKDMYL
jgi:hypothetical protein